MFVFMFEPVRLAFEFILVEFIFVFVDTVAIGVAIGVGLAMFVLRFALLLLTELLAASPQAMPSDPSANTAVSAIFFMIVNDLLSSSKFKFNINCNDRK